jgi:hypothetical protein
MTRNPDTFIFNDDESVLESPECLLKSTESRYRFSLDAKKLLSRNRGQKWMPDASLRMRKAM